jgi:hypothetical protein
LVLDQFFNGELTTHGILENSCGEIIRYFNVTINRSLDDQGVGTLAEKFIFNDENRQFRTWTFTPPRYNDRWYSIPSTTNDILAATIIYLSGNAFSTSL